MAEQKTYSIKIDGIEQSVKGVESLGENVSKTGNAWKETQKALKEVKAEMAGLDKNSAQWQELAKVAGEYRDKLDDINQAARRFASDTKALDDAINIGQSMTSVYTFAEGAMSAFGMSTDGVVESIQKLQGAMAMLQSLQALQNALRGSTATSDLLSKSMKALTVSMEGASTGAKALRVALMGIGIGIIIALIAELVTHWEDLTKALGFATKAQEEANEAMEAGTKAYAKAKAEMEALTAKVNTFNGSKEQEKQLVDELNSKYGSAFGHYKTLAEWKDVLKKKTEAYCQSLLLEAQMQAKVNQLSQAYEKVTKTKKEWDRVKGGDRTYWEQIKDFFNPGGTFDNARTEFNEARNGATKLEEEIDVLAKQIVELNQNNELFNFSPTIEKNGKKSIDKAKEVAKKIAEEWVKAEREGLKAAQALRDEINEKQKKDAEDVAKAKDKLSKSEYERDLAILDAEKERLTIEGKYLTKEEDIKKNKDKINELEEKRLKLVKERAALEAKNEAASALGIDPSKIDEILDLTTGKYKDLTEQQKLVIDNLKTQLETLDIGLATALSKLFGGDGNSGGSSDKQNAFSKWFGDDLTQAFIDLGQMTFDAVADTLSMTMDWVIEEAQDKLDEVSELHDEAVEKVAESQDRISELNDKMRESSGAQLEQYKQQMVDEMLLLQQREQEEKRLQKEKEKREKELEKKQHQQRKQDMQIQLLESISATALGVMKAFAQFGPILGAIMGGIVSTMGAIQQAIIMKQISKMADGGVLGGREHKDGGNPIPSMGVEVEKGEAVINKRSTAKFLPLLDAINAEGNGGKHTLLQSSGNVIRRYADGGVLNYQRIDDNFNQLNGTAAIANAIGSIDFHPVVSVQEISRVQRNVVEVRELAGANN